MIDWQPNSVPGGGIAKQTKRNDLEFLMAIGRISKPKLMLRHLLT